MKIKHALQEYLLDIEISKFSAYMVERGNDFYPHATKRSSPLYLKPECSKVK